ncbi:hypothetical protein AS029_07845 [Microbacterium enclense]|nr:hypothetical protein AS029_07845 [Microbacterium enclense]
MEAPRGWWEVLNQLDADLAAIDPEYELRRAARVDNELIFWTATNTAAGAFARRIREAQTAVRAICNKCGRPGVPRTRSREVLCDLHWHPLTAAEKAFALSAGIPEAWFSEKAEIENEAFLAEGEARDRKNLAAHLTEMDMARVLNVSVHRVRDMFEQEVLAGAEHDGRIVYPRWQVTDDGRLLPGLAAVVEAAGDMDARTLQAIMENVDEELDGLAPAEWLARGKPVGPVVQILEESWWT